MDQERAKFEEVARFPFLPAQPIGFSKVDHVKPVELPESFMNEIEPLIRSATEKDGDPISQEYTTKHDSTRAWRAAVSGPTCAPPCRSERSLQMPPPGCRCFSIPSLFAV